MAKFSNQATLTYSGGSAASNVATGELLCTLTAAKHPLCMTYDAGGTATFVLCLANGGDSPISNVSLSDDLGCPDGTQAPLALCPDSLRVFSGGSLLPSGYAVQAGPPLTLTGLTIPPNGDVEVVYGADVTGYAPLGTAAEIVNSVQITGDGIPDQTVTATITQKQAPVLSLEKAVIPPTVAPGAPISYTFTIANAGPVAATAADKVVISDQLQPNLTGITATLDGAPFTAFTQTGALFATNEGAIPVPAATYAKTQEGLWYTIPGTATLVISGTP